MAQYILNMGGYNNGTRFNTVDVFKVTANGVTKISNHGLTLSVARSNFAAASCGEYILAMGGEDNNGLSRTVDVFKVTDNGVEAVQNHGLSLSVVRSSLAAASCGNYILAMGGKNGAPSYSYLNTVDVFKVTDNGVEAVPNHGLTLSVGGSELAAASCGEYILAMGGWNGNDALNTVDVFQVTANGVTKISNHGLTLSVARNALAAASAGNYILAMGGSYRNTSSSTSFTNTVDVFKVTDNGVTKVPNHGLSLSIARRDLAAASCGEYILAMGGRTSSSVLNTVDVFKVTDNGAEAVPNHGLSLSVGRTWLAAASAGSYILAMGGDDGSTSAYSNTVDVFQCFE